MVRLLTDLALDNGSGVLTLTTGTLELNGLTLTLGTDFTLNSADATLAIGTGDLQRGHQRPRHHLHHRHGHPDHRHPERLRADPQRGRGLLHHHRRRLRQPHRGHRP